MVMKFFVFLAAYTDCKLFVFKVCFIAMQSRGYTHFSTDDMRKKILYMNVLSIMIYTERTKFLLALRRFTDFQNAKKYYSLNFVPYLGSHVNRRIDYCFI